MLGTIKETKAQVFYIGVNGGAVYTWFNSPGIDNIITANGWGHDLGFFLRYGKRPYFQVGLDWIRTKNQVTLETGIQEERREDIPFHIFDFSFKVGYEFVQLPMFKLKAHAGPFIGRSFLLSKDDFYVETSDFNNPQYGVIAGIGFQFTNFVLDLEYTYHIDDLWEPLDVYGTEFRFKSNLQLLSLKVGFMF
jgi:hypothetical protein